MAMANDLIVVFLGLEILSIALYVMAGMHLRRTESQEAAIKYFVLGAFSSAFLPVRHRPRLRGHRARPT
jgi:NADH-quinone oxidoreductase subunit N